MLKSALSSPFGWMVANAAAFCAGGCVAVGIYFGANGLAATGLSPFGPSPQAVSSASPLPSHFARRLPSNEICASDGRSLDSITESSGKRRSNHGYWWLNACRSDRFYCERYPQHQLDRRRLRRPRRHQHGLIGRGADPIQTEAASGGSRYSASAVTGLPPHFIAAGAA